MIGPYIESVNGPNESQLTVQDHSMSVLRIADGEPINIGMMIIQEGRYVSYGTGVYEGAYLASQELSPFPGHAVRLVVAAETPEPREIEDVLTKFVRERVIAVVGPMTFEAAMASVPLLDEAGLCAVVPSISNPDLTRWGHNNVVRIDSDAGAQAKVQAEYAYGSLGAKKIAVVHDTSVFWTGVARTFEMESKGAVTRRTTFLAGTKDFNWVIWQVVRLSPDLIYGVGDSTDLMALVRALRRRNVHTPFLGCAALRATEIHQAAGFALGDLYVTEWQPVQARDHTFRVRFEKMYWHEPSYYSTEAYDSVTAIVRGLESVARVEGNNLEVDRRAFRRAIKHIQFNGATGEVDFDRNGNRRNAGKITVVTVSPDIGAQDGPREPQLGQRTTSTVSSTHEPLTNVEVFFPYSHKDERLRGELAEHLSILRRQGMIADWHDRKITAGSEWKGQIDKHLNAARVILLLISRSFLASDYCYDVEMKRAMERHAAGEALVIPVILRECLWKRAPFANLQATPRDAKPVMSWSYRDKAFMSVVEDVLAAVERVDANNALRVSLFLTCSQPHVDFAQRLRADLQARGASCYLYDVDSIQGQLGQEEIGEKLSAAEKVLVLCSAATLVRDGILKEIAKLADEAADKILPISLDGLWKNSSFTVKRGKWDLKPILLDRSPVDFENADRYSENLERLLMGVRKL